MFKIFQNLRFGIKFSRSTVYIDSCVDLRICKRNPHGRVLRWNSCVSSLPFFHRCLPLSASDLHTVLSELQVLFYLRVSHLLFSFPSSPVFGFLATSTLIFAARDERMQILRYKRGSKGTMVLFYFARSIDLVPSLNIYFIYLE